MRPLVLEFQDDRGVHGIGEQFTIGENLLLAPVFDPDGYVDVYLPPGRWVDYWTGETYEGSQTLSMQVELEEMPVFLRAGTITPTTEPAERVREEPFEDVRLRVVLGDGTTEATFAYADGEVAGTIRAVADDDHREVAFGFEPSEGSTLSPGRFDATVECVNGSPDAVTLDAGEEGGTETLDRVDSDPDAGEWTVEDDGRLTVVF